MPEPFSADPAEVEAFIRGLPVTFDPLAGDEDTMKPEDRAEMDHHFQWTKRGHPTAITAYCRLVRAYPHIPSLKNHLFVALSGAGRNRQANDLLEETFREHPDYLFARVNLAIACIESGKPAEAMPYLGESLQIPSLPPGRDRYHHSEIRSYYVAVAMLHLSEDRVEVASAIHRALQALEGAEDGSVRQLALDIAAWRFKSLKERMAEDEARAIRVEVVRRGSRPDPGFLPPSFRHREVEALYQYDFDLPRSVIHDLLALPRETLIADLEAVLRDTRDRGELFVEGRLPGGEKQTAFPMHAIFLLGELGAADSLPRIYEILAEDDEWLDFWFGDHLGLHLWRPLRQLVPGRLEEAEAWVLAPNRPVESRNTVPRAIAELALAEPEHRPAALDWFRRVLVALLAAKPGDGVLDTRFVTGLVDQAMNLQAVELRPLVAELYAKRLVALAMVGDLSEYDRAMAEAPRHRKLRGLPPLAESYREFQSTPRWFDETEPFPFPLPGLQAPPSEASRVLPLSDLDRLSGALSSHRPAPASAAPKAGRNAPCPCGSGRKFKKCCG